MPAVAVGAGAAAVAKTTVMARPLAADSVTGTEAVDTPPVPSTFCRSAILIVGAASSSVIVPLTEAVAIEALTAPARPNPNVSSASSSASGLMVIATVLAVSPGA